MADPERHLRLVDERLDLRLLVRGCGTAGLCQRPLRDDHPRLSVGGRDEVAHRKSVRVGGDHHDPLSADLHEHAGQDRPRLVTRRGSRDLKGCIGERPGLHGDPRARWLLEARKILGRQQSQRPLVRGAPDPGLGLVGLEVHRSIRQRLHRVAQQAGGDECLHVDRQARGDLEIGRREDQGPAIGRLDQHPRQRRDPGPGRHPTLDDLQRLRERVAVTPELHRCPPPVPKDLLFQIEVVVPVEKCTTPPFVQRSAARRHEENRWGKPVALTIVAWRR